jgi:hypothetical protein
MTKVQLLTGLAAALVPHAYSALADAQSQARAICLERGPTLRDRPRTRPLP